KPPPPRSASPVTVRNKRVAPFVLTNRKKERHDARSALSATHGPRRAGPRAARSRRPVERRARRRRSAHARRAAGRLEGQAHRLGEGEARRRRVELLHVEGDELLGPSPEDVALLILLRLRPVLESCAVLRAVLPRDLRREPAIGTAHDVHARLAIDRLVTGLH